MQLDLVSTNEIGQNWVFLSGNVTHPIDCIDMSKDLILPLLLHSVASLLKNAGGPSRTVTALCRELGRLGLQVDLVSIMPLGAHFEDLLLPPRRWVTTTLATRSDPSTVGFRPANPFRAAVCDCCRKQQIQLVHDHGLWLPSNHASASVARELGLPLIISTRGMLEPWALAHRAWKKRLAWRLYQHRDLRAAKVLHATSEMEAENLRRLGLYQPIAVIPNGAELEGFAEEVGDGGPNQAPRRADGQERIALFLSRIHPKKGLLPLVEAWNRLRPTGWRVIIAGPDEAGHRGEVEASIRLKGLESVFEFVGAVDGEAKLGLYRSADLFVLPTFSENFGVVVAEALACGVPVITTKGAPWQGLETHGCGWWIELGVDPLVVALRQATSTPTELLRAMGERGRVYAESTYGWPGIAKEMLSVYRWMLNQGPRPACVRD